MTTQTLDVPGATLTYEDDGSRTDPLLGQNLVTGTHYEPDFDALGCASTLVLAAGA